MSAVTTIIILQPIALALILQPITMIIILQLIALALILQPITMIIILQPIALALLFLGSLWGLMIFVYMKRKVEETMRNIGTLHTCNITSTVCIISLCTAR